jgi:galactokinase
MLFRAPGRVNIIGEHTDYNDGLVLPTTTALYTTVAATPRADRIVKVASREMQDDQDFALDEIEPAENSGWIDYAKGVAAELEATGIQLQGANLDVQSDIPIGGGLSSSASFELAIAHALLHIAGVSMPAAEIARLCQRAENRYAGVTCGIMDQYAIACCESGNAMLLDCRSLEITQVTVPDAIHFLIIDSGVKHQLPDSGYNERSEECAEAAKVLGKVIPKVSALRDLDMQELDSEKDRLGDVLYRRCRHVVSENQRVRDAFAAMQSGDIENLGKLIGTSHISLRDDFEVSCAEVDQLVTIADSATSVLGSRMIGAGFGGCVLSIVRSADADHAIREIRREYKKVSGDEPWTHILQAAYPAQATGTKESILKR